MPLYSDQNMNSNQRVLVTPNPNGPLDGPIAFSTSDPSIASVQPNGYITPATPPKNGSCVITATDTSQGNPIDETFNVNISQPPATTLGLTFGAPIPK